ncbi:ribosome assembly protein METTL17, mitochondrial [Nomia melanderi]|uniref:ribosome assembly protein METTL17, mitochondrial n=1 Tax=Nomia melanderi TaxID=2448451 RepID=UPI0013041971|nr:methyltransferase-like protein 17, mitochondrial [Nomia melanderi]XP_031828111.1 methyltransferase-like protein 17, mitochondrial [Nomia melanderi]
MSTKLTFARYKQLRWYSTKNKFQVIEPVLDKISVGEMKHRTHPGIIRPRVPEHPKWLYDVIRILLKDTSIPIKSIYTSGQKMALYLKGRHAPPEGKDIEIKLKKVQNRLKQDISMEDLQHNQKALRLFKDLVYHWAPIEYDRHTGLSYLVSRSVPEYTVLYKIFNEIKHRDTDFVPKTLFDFGSGVGTVMWAASYFWVKSIMEYYCVDVSGDMNDLSEYIIKRATPHITSKYIFYRQFLPASPVPTYDIVVSAYSLLELPNQKTRIEVIKKLWDKTSRYLIIVEQGTKVGFEIINEARDFILNYTEKDESGVHVFSPCPHDLTCPRSLQDKLPCNFEVVYLTLPIPKTSEYKRERYSYVVLKKEKRSENDDNWPRLINQVLKRSKHAICRMCAASGELHEQVFTAWQNGKQTYRCARSSEWGDRLPVTTEKTKEITEADKWREKMKIEGTVDKEGIEEIVDEEGIEETADEKRIKETMEIEEVIDLIKKLMDEKERKEATGTEETDVLPSNDPNKH